MLNSFESYISLLLFRIKSRMITNNFMKILKRTTANLKKCKINHILLSISMEYKKLRVKSYIEK